MIQDLECVRSGSVLEVRDASLGSWILRLRPTTKAASSDGRVVTSSVAAVGALAQSFAPVASLLAEAASTGQSMQVVFSAGAQRAIASGGLRLMNSPAGSLPLAVDQLGRIRAVARVVPSGGVVAGPALVPILLPAAAAAAAAYYQHKALEATLNDIRKAVDRIETRLRDDDWAVLESGDELAQFLVDGTEGWDVPDQLRIELAVARQQVERVFRSRRRFVQHLVTQLNADMLGRSDPWTDRIKKLFKGDDNWIEVSQFLGAMVVRARLTDCTAFVLATDGEARASASLARSAVDELEHSYRPLITALERLADKRPEGGPLDRIPGRKVDDDRFWYVRNLVREMDSGIGHALRALNEETSLTIPAHEVRALDQGAASSGPSDSDYGAMDPAEAPGLE
jgi:hypothetical protein